MPFLNAIGITNISIIYNIAFSLVSLEGKEAYIQIIRALNNLYIELNILQLRVIIIDFKKGLNNTLITIFPAILQQIYLQHILKNVIYKVKKKQVLEGLEDNPKQPREQLTQQAPKNEP